MKRNLVSVQSGDWYDESNDDSSMARLAACGFEAIDFNIDHIFNPAEYRKGKKFPICDLNLDEIKELYAPVKAAAEKYGITFSQTHAPFPIYYPGEDEVNECIFSVLEKSIAINAFIGCPATVIHPYTTANKELCRKVNMDIYTRLIPIAKKYKVKICLENLFYCINGSIYAGECADPREAREYIDELNAIAQDDVFGFCFDVGHANLVGQNLRNFINILGKSRLTVLHIHDNNGIKDQHLMPYTQTIGWSENLATDWNGFIAGLKDIDYEGTLSFETFKATKWFPSELTDDVLKLICAIGKYMRAKITEV